MNRINLLNIFFHIELSVLCSTVPRERTTVVQVLSVRPHHLVLSFICRRWGKGKRLFLIWIKLDILVFNPLAAVVLQPPVTMIKEQQQQK